MKIKFSNFNLISKNKYYAINEVLIIDYFKNQVYFTNYQLFFQEYQLSP